MSLDQGRDWVGPNSGARAIGHELDRGMNLCESRNLSRGQDGTGAGDLNLVHDIDGNVA